MVHSDADLTWRLSLSLADGGRGENGPSHYISSGMSVWEKVLVVALIAVPHANP